MSVARVWGVWVGAALLSAGCGSKPEEVPESSATADAPPAAEAAKAEVYPICQGQTPGISADSREGEMRPQLAPAFLDQMAVCSGYDIEPPEELAVHGPGRVNEKGNCAWDNGVSCHYHLGVEFLASNAARPRVGEIHCIFPSADAAKSPEVFGGHFTCKPGRGAPVAVLPAAKEGEHGAKGGVSCGNGLLTELSAGLAHCSSVRCCDDGTLTNTPEEREKGKSLDVRPDFHICESTMQLDCSALVSMTGHEANAPAFGEPVAGDFAIPGAAPAVEH